MAWRVLRLWMYPHQLCETTSFSSYIMNISNEYFQITGIVSTASFRSRFQFLGCAAVSLGQQILLFCHTAFILSVKQSKKNVWLWRWRHYNQSGTTCPITCVTSQKTCIFSNAAVITSNLYYIMYFSFYIFLPRLMVLTALSGPGPPNYQGFTMTPRHTTHGRTPLDEWSARCRDFHLTTYRPTTMTPAGLQSTIQATEWMAADRHVRPLDHATTGIPL
jgi:hypothetical protein